jgi:hypothetical protein
VSLWAPSSLDLANPLQRGASQPVSITCDVVFSFPIEVGHATIKCGNELVQVIDEAVV